MAIATINPTTGVTEKTLVPHDASEVAGRISRAEAAAGIREFCNLKTIWEA